ncbi:MAG: S-layer homology domain-containing protein [Clostridia bacterium]|nr:S-layer homology domain-containing protein [Clostridia bacterium]
MPSPRRALAAFAAGLLFAVAAFGPAPAARAQSGPGADFSDIDGHWAQATIEAYLQRGVIDPSADGKFHPDDPVTRLDFTVWLARGLELEGQAAGAPPFKDFDRIPEDLQPAVAAAVAAGLVKGYPDGTFRPQATITRAELATLIGRSLESMGVPAEARWFAIFGDGDTIPAWALPAAAAIARHIIYGVPSTKPRLDFEPNRTATRAEAITMIDRYLTQRGEIEPELIPTPTPGRLGAPPYFAAYYVNTDYGYETLLAHGGDLDFTVYTGYSLGADGSLSGAASPRTMTWAAATGKPVLAMISAHSRTANNRLLQDDDAMRAAVAAIAGLMAQGYAGVNLDMENVDASLRDRYTSFVRQIAEALSPAGKLVTLSVMAKTADMPTNSLVGVYDYRALGQIADYVMIMTYDYHWSGGPPGPIAPISWVRNVLSYATGQMPAQKIFVGIPTYAYLWPQGGGRALATAAWDAADQAARHGATPTRVPEGEVTFTARLDDGRTYTAYYNDTTAILQKIALVGDYGLAGAIMWRLGFEEEAGWPSLVAAFAELARD